MHPFCQRVLDLYLQDQAASAAGDLAEARVLGDQCNEQWSDVLLPSVPEENRKALMVARMDMDAARVSKDAMRIETAYAEWVEQLTQASRVLTAGDLAKMLIEQSGMIFSAEHLKLAKEKALAGVDAQGNVSAEDVLRAWREDPALRPLADAAATKLFLR